MANAVRERTSMRSNSGTERKKFFDIGFGAEIHHARPRRDCTSYDQQYDFTPGREVRNTEPIQR